MKDHHLNIFIEFAKFSFNKHLYSSSQSIFHKNFIQNAKTFTNIFQPYLITICTFNPQQCTKRRKLRRKGEEEIRTRKLEVLKLANLIADVSTPPPSFYATTPPVSTRSLTGYCDKRITRSCENVYA